MGIPILGNPLIHCSLIGNPSGGGRMAGVGRKILYPLLSVRGVGRMAGVGRNISYQLLFDRGVGRMAGVDRNLSFWLLQLFSSVLVSVSARTRLCLRLGSPLAPTARFLNQDSFRYILLIYIYIRWVNVTPIFDKYEQNNP